MTLSYEALTLMKDIVQISWETSRNMTLTLSDVFLNYIYISFELPHMANFIV